MRSGLFLGVGVRLRLEPVVLASLVISLMASFSEDSESELSELLLLGAIMGSE